MLGLGKYPGGKAHAARWILPHLPLGFDWYVEPFCGNSPFLTPKFRHFLDPAETKVWVNDLDVLVHNVLRALADRPETYIDDFLSRRECCRHCPFETRVAFETAKLDVRLDHDPAAYLLLRRLALREVIRLGRRNIASLSTLYSQPGQHPDPERNGYPQTLAGMTKTKLGTAAATVRQLARISNLDFREVLSSLPTNSAIYLDPPYWGAATDRLYDHVMSEEDHVELAQMLATLDSSDHRWLLSLDITELSHDLYIADGRFWYIQIPVRYSASTPRKSTSRQYEYLIANYPLV